MQTRVPPCSFTPLRRPPSPGDADLAKRLAQPSSFFTAWRYICLTLFTEAIQQKDRWKTPILCPYYRSEVPCVASVESNRVCQRPKRIYRTHKGTLICRLRFSGIFQDFKIVVWKDTRAQNLLPECIFTTLKTALKIEQKFGNTKNCHDLKRARDVAKS